jgi:D-sedoheptulose 7-phosphate isomerase
MNHVHCFLAAVQEIAAQLMRTETTLCANRIDNLAVELTRLRGRRGRLFLIGVGGSAANASHAAADFRKLCGIEAYAPTDNVAELTARTNDEGWGTVFAAWLRVSRLSPNDAVLIFSVGGGTAGVSSNIIEAIDLAKALSAKVFAVVGLGMGHAAKHADLAIVIPQDNPAWVTPLSEAFQAVIWHCLVSHPLLQRSRTVWP